MAMRRGYVDVSKELMLRILGGTLVFSAIMGGIFYGGWHWVAVVSVCALASLWEFYSLFDPIYHISKKMGMVAGALLLTAATMRLTLASFLSVIALIAFLILFAEVVKRQLTGESSAFINMGGTLAGLVYVVLPWSFLIILREETFGKTFLITLFLCTWSCDVAAYFVGKNFGQNLLCSRVSPKKTWEGFAGGVVASLLCAGVLAFISEFPSVTLLLLGLLCGVAGQLGDLGESVLKREASVKDASSLIPGHGGFLDRFDSILVNAVLAFFLFTP